jgi:hypothetical protein
MTSSPFCSSIKHMKIYLISKARQLEYYPRLSYLPHPYIQSVMLHINNGLAEIFPNCDYWSLIQEGILSAWIYLPSLLKIHWKRKPKYKREKIHDTPEDRKTEEFDDFL